MVSRLSASKPGVASGKAMTAGAMKMVFSVFASDVVASSSSSTANKHCNGRKLMAERSAGADAGSSAGACPSENIRSCLCARSRVLHQSRRFDLAEIADVAAATELLFILRSRYGGTSRKVAAARHLIGRRRVRAWAIVPFLQTY
jgi:hypothetical protein